MVGSNYSPGQARMRLPLLRGEFAKQTGVAGYYVSVHRKDHFSAIG